MNITFSVQFTTKQPGVNIKLPFLRQWRSSSGMFYMVIWYVFLCTCVYICALGGWMDAPTSKCLQRGPGSLREEEHPIILSR